MSAVCSRAGCSAPATTRIEWRNPRIHAEDRVKIWLACSDHVDVLTEFLTARSFPVVAVPFEGADAGVDARVDVGAEAGA